jgi:hypothetical protein
MFRKLRRLHGKCDPPTLTGKTITLDTQGTPLELLDTAIHEGLHAALWDLSEDVIEEVATDIARFIARLVAAGHIQIPR